MRTFLWLASGDEQLSQYNINIIEKSAQRRELRLSVITLWEISYLLKKAGLTSLVTTKLIGSRISSGFFVRILQLTSTTLFKTISYLNTSKESLEIIICGMILMTSDSKIMPSADQLATARILAVNVSNESEIIP